MLTKRGSTPISDVTTSTFGVTLPGGPPNTGNPFPLFPPDCQKIEFCTFTLRIWLLFPGGPEKTTPFSLYATVSFTMSTPSMRLLWRLAPPLMLRTIGGESSVKTSLEIVVSRNALLFAAPVSYDV